MIVPSKAEATWWMCWRWHSASWKTLSTVRNNQLTFCLAAPLGQLLSISLCDSAWGLQGCWQRKPCYLPCSNWNRLSFKRWLQSFVHCSQWSSPTTQHRQMHYSGAGLWLPSSKFQRAHGLIPFRSTTPCQRGWSVMVLMLPLGSVERLLSTTRCQVWHRKTSVSWKPVSSWTCLFKLTSLCQSSSTIGKIIKMQRVQCPWRCLPTSAVMYHLKHRVYGRRSWPRRQPKTKCSWSTWLVFLWRTSKMACAWRRKSICGFRHTGCESMILAWPTGRVVCGCISGLRCKARCHWKNTSAWRKCLAVGHLTESWVTGCGPWTQP